VACGKLPPPVDLRVHIAISITQTETFVCR